MCLVVERTPLTTGNCLVSPLNVHKEVPLVSRTAKISGLIPSPFFLSKKTQRTSIIHSKPKFRKRIKSCAHKVWSILTKKQLLYGHVWSPITYCPKRRKFASFFLYGPWANFGTPCYACRTSEEWSVWKPMPRSITPDTTRCFSRVVLRALPTHIRGKADWFVCRVAGYFRAYQSELHPNCATTALLRITSRHLMEISLPWKLGPPH